MRIGYTNFGTPADAQNCGISSGCSDDAVIYSTTLITNVGQTGLAGTEFYFFEDGLLDKPYYQSVKEDISSAFPNTFPVAKFFKTRPAGFGFTVQHIGLQIVNAHGAAIPSPADMKTIADNGIFEAFLPGNASAGLQRVNNNSSVWDGFNNPVEDISGPVIQFPSHVGLFGNTTESSSGVVSLGQPNLTMAKSLGSNELVLGPNDRMIARIRFPAAADYTTFQARNRPGAAVDPVAGVGAASAPPALGLASDGGAPVITPPPAGTGIVAVRLFMYGQAK